MGKTEKKRKENQATKVISDQHTKNQKKKYGIKQNICPSVRFGDVRTDFFHCGGDRPYLLLFVRPIKIRKRQTVYLSIFLCAVP